MSLPPVPLYDDMKRIPEDAALRQRLRQAVKDRAQRGIGGFTRHALDKAVRELLLAENLPVDFLAWTMVHFGSALWERRVRNVPYDRRLLLLPHCLRDSVRCPAEYSDVELLCRSCGACALPGIVRHAETLGYHVLIAEGTPIVMRMILGGTIDAILGVGCLKSLERAFEKLQLAGIPAMAVPLDTGNCVDSRVEVDAVLQMLETPYAPGIFVAKNPWRTGTQDTEPVASAGAAEDDATLPARLHLLRGTARLFESPLLERLLPRRRDGESPAFASTETLAYDFLLRGGKFYRPFITLAVYDAMIGAPATRPDGERAFAAIPDHVKRTAMAVEIFHKASLIHDDIEDDDPFRYGKPALHVAHGTATAINVGDYLLGLGYRLIAGDRADIGPATVEILAVLSDAHTHLAEGQGMELSWKSRPVEELLTLSPQEVLRIDVLKTAPAFEAALRIGAELAAASGTPNPSRLPQPELAEMLRKFSRHLGVGFQIRNDLDDWSVERENKRVWGRDLLDRRPTFLLALALEQLSGEKRDLLLRLLADDQSLPAVERIEAIRRLYTEAGVFEAARILVSKYARRAVETVAEVTPPALADLLVYFVEALLE